MLDEVPARSAPVAPANPGLDLSALPAGMYAVPNGETRLKVQIDRPDDEKWNGWIFVKDGAVYGEGRKYGHQSPGWSYKGEIEAELRAILADPDRGDGGLRQAHLDVRSLPSSAGEEGVRRPWYRSLVLQEDARGGRVTDQPSITCPVCRMTSYHPEDIRQGYCGNCHDWTGSVTPGSPASLPEQEPPHPQPLTWVLRDMEA